MDIIHSSFFLFTMIELSLKSELYTWQYSRINMLDVGNKQECYEGVPSSTTTLNSVHY